MNKKILLSATAVITMTFMAGIHQAEAITTSGSIDAVILEAITLTAGDTLDFGNIIAGTALSTVVIAPVTGARTLGSGDAVLAAGGGEQDGTFNLDGTDNATVTIDVPANGTVQVSSGGNDMDVDAFTWS